MKERSKPTPKGKIQFKILEYLAKHGPAYRNQIYDEVDIGSRPNIIKTFKELISIGAIQCESKPILTRKDTASTVSGMEISTGFNKRGRKPREYYNLTLYGVVQLLSSLSDWSISKNHQKLVSMLVTKHDSLLPTVSQCWKWFIDTDMEDLAIERLVWASRPWKNYLKVPPIKEQGIYSTDRFIRDEITHNFLLPWELSAEPTNPYVNPHVGKIDGNRRTWWEAIRDNPKLRKTVMDLMLDKAVFFVHELNGYFKRFGTEDLRVELASAISKLDEELMIEAQRLWAPLREELALEECQPT